MPKPNHPGGPSLKQLLKSSDILLKPPSPLSSNPPDLLQRLRQCSRSLPKEWRRQTPEWCDEDEQEQIGDQVFSTHAGAAVEDTQGVDNATEERRKRRRDELVFVVGKRCFALIKAMQQILEKEFWPKDLRGGMEQSECRSRSKNSASASRSKQPRSPRLQSHPHTSSKPQKPTGIAPVKSQPSSKHTQCKIPNYPRHHADLNGNVYPKSVLLGTADLRLIRLMLSHTTFSYLLPLTSHYAAALPNILPKTAESLSIALVSLLSLLKTTTPPAPAAGPSSRAPTPPTTITQTLLTSHLIPLFLSTLVIAYTPSIPSEQYASLRSAFMQALLSLSPGHAISSLVNVLKLLVQGRKEGVKINGWVREWPKYPEGIINGLLTAQVRRPGGVRGLMENVLGETAKTDDVTSIDGKRLDHIFNVLVRIPRQVTPEMYHPWLLSELFAMIPLTDSSHHHPVAFVNTACYCIQRLWASNRPLIGDWLTNKLHSPWYPKSPPVTETAPVVVTTWEAIQRSVQNMRLLLLHNPTSPEFANFLVGSILPPLFSLYSFLGEKDNSQSMLAISSKGRRIQADTTGSQLKEHVGSVLKIWGKTVEQDEGVKGIWSIVQGGKGWNKKLDSESVEFTWEKDGDGVRLMSRRSYGATEQHVSLPSLSQIGQTDDDLAHHMIGQQKASPDPSLMCHYMKSLQRPDIASEVILKSLDVWRIRTATELEPSIESLLNLQLTIQMMEQLGAQLFTKPDQVLGFVERVLNDQVQALEQPRINGEKDESLIVEVGVVDEAGMDNDAAPDGKRGLIEVACQLLASLEAEGQLDSGDLTIIHPIIAHLEALSTRSPSVSIRNAAREARLLLLSRQSAPGGDGLGVTSKASDETYKQALTFLADPNLPVRAHGLAMLRDLVLSPDFDRGLIPDILDIFMRELENDDSFIYLSAIKGLCGMVDKLGKEVFDKLMRAYMDGVEGSKGGNGGIRLDKTLRLAEAVDQVIERTGEALGQYADQIAPPLMSVFPDTSLPTVIRSSALSLLSTSARISPYSILPWVAGLTDAVLDLVQIESVASSPFRPEPLAEAGEPTIPLKTWGKSKKVQLVDDESDHEPEEESPKPEPAVPRTIDAEPTKADDGKHPTLRRAALNVLNWIFRVLLFVNLISADQDSGHDSASEPEEFNLRLPSSSTVTHQADARSADSGVTTLSPSTVERAGTILGYIALTDDDELTRQYAELAMKDLVMLRTGGLDVASVDIGLPSGLERGLQAVRIS